MRETSFQNSEQLPLYRLDIKDPHIENIVKILSQWLSPLLNYFFEKNATNDIKFIGSDRRIATDFFIWIHDKVSDKLYIMHRKRALALVCGPG